MSDTVGVRQTLLGSPPLFSPPLTNTILTKEERTVVRDLLNKTEITSPFAQDIVISKFNVDLHYFKLECLKPGKWLNDEPINFYLLMLQERDDSCKRRHRYFNTLFYTKLLEDGVYSYPQVARWTKKFRLFDMEKIFIPIHIYNSHWALCVMFVQEKIIR